MHFIENYDSIIVILKLVKIFFLFCCILKGFDRGIYLMPAYIMK